MSIIISLVGGLGLFLYGMKLMSEGLQKVAGAKMRSFLEMFSKDRFIGVLAGTFLTALIQSSNAVTIMIVSFVNSGLMELQQTVGIILGANIGTTVTGQLIAFDLSFIAPLCVLLGVIMCMFVKNHLIVNRLGEAFLGFGILFMGITMMGQAMNDIREVPQVMAVFTSLDNPFLALLAGLAVTALVQSNSAMIGVIMLLARDHLISIPICMYMMLGCNIGCTMSALLASIGCRRDAKRAAVIHLLINLSGAVLWSIALMTAGDTIIQMILRVSGNEAGRTVANANTLIKLCEVAVLFPFAKFLVKASCRIIPDSDKAEEEFDLVYIGNYHVFSPTTAVLQAVREMERMADMALTNLIRAMNTLVTHDQKDIDEVYQVERNINYLNQKITDYLVHLNQSGLPIDDAMSIGSLFHVVNDIERIGDFAKNVADFSVRMREQEITFSRNGERELSDMLDLVLKILTYANEMFSTNDKQHLADILSLENEIDKKERILQERHVERLTQNECTPQAGMFFSDLISGLERVADHAANIAYSILEDDPDEENHMQE
jgi:phosphate:Na+ symporter